MPFPLDRIKGSIPPLFTPFRNGEVDYDTYARMIEHQIKEGSHGILVNGTTSEPASLTVEERNRLVTLDHARRARAECRWWRRPARSRSPRPRCSPSMR